MSDVARIQEAAAGVLRDVSVFEQNQEAIRQDVAELEQDLAAYEVSLEVLEANPPAAPKIVNATLHNLESEFGWKSFASFLCMFLRIDV